MRLQGIALGEEYHHLGGIFAVIETDHFTVEFQRPRGGDTDRIITMPHQPAVHHMATGAFITVKEKLEICAEQKHRQPTFKRRQRFNLANAFGKNTV